MNTVKCAKSDGVLILSEATAVVRMICSMLFFTFSQDPYLSLKSECRIMVHFRGHMHLFNVQECAVLFWLNFHPLHQLNHPLNHLFSSTLIAKCMQIAEEWGYRASLHGLSSVCWLQPSDSAASHYDHVPSRPGRDSQGSQTVGKEDLCPLCLHCH